MEHRSTKTWGHDLGLSACFRQWRADSHCRFLHGYALAVRVEFAANQLDERNWVVDFGGLKDFGQWLRDTFDHKTLVARDDPELDWFIDARDKGLIDLVLCQAVGCEAFAQLIHQHADAWLRESGHAPRCWVHLVEVREHGANSAVATGGSHATASQ